MPGPGTSMVCTTLPVRSAINSTVMGYLLSLRLNRLTLSTLPLSHGPSMIETASWAATTPVVVGAVAAVLIGFSCEKVGPAIKADNLDPLSHPPQLRGPQALPMCTLTGIASTTVVVLAARTAVLGLPHRRSICLTRKMGSISVEAIHASLALRMGSSSAATAVFTAPPRRPT